MIAYCLSSIESYIYASCSDQEKGTFQNAIEETERKTEVLAVWVHLRILLFNQSFYRPLRSPQAEKPNSKLNLFFCDLQEKPNTQSSSRILSLSNYELKFKRKHKRLMRFLHPFLISSDISRWQHEGLPVVLVSVTTWRSDMWPAMKGSLRCFSVLHRNKEGRFPVNRYFCEIALFYSSLSWLLKTWKYR